MQNIDVEAIMDEIRREIAEKGLKEEDLSFSDIPLDIPQTNQGQAYVERELLAQCSYMNNNYNNPIYWPLQGNPVKVFVQRLVRRMFLFVIFQAFQHQNRFNASVVRAVNQIKNYIDESHSVEDAVKAHQRELEECKRQIAELKEQLEALQK